KKIIFLCITVFLFAFVATGFTYKFAKNENIFLTPVVLALEGGTGGSADGTGASGNDGGTGPGDPGVGTGPGPGVGDPGKAGEGAPGPGPTGRGPDPAGQGEGEDGNPTGTTDGRSKGGEGSRSTDESYGGTGPTDGRSAGDKTRGSEHPSSPGHAETTAATNAAATAQNAASFGVNLAARELEKAIKDLEKTYAEVQRAQERVKNAIKSLEKKERTAEDVGLQPDEVSKAIKEGFADSKAEAGKNVPAVGLVKIKLLDNLVNKVFDLFNLRSTKNQGAAVGTIETRSELDEFRQEFVKLKVARNNIDDAIVVLKDALNDQIEDEGLEELYGLTPNLTPDLESPSTPTNLSASAISDTQISLSWRASVDNVGVAGYKVFRNGAEITTVSGLSYTDSSRSPQTSYTYRVSAYDRAGNNSAQSGSANATTESPPPPPPPTPAEQCAQSGGNWINYGESTYGCYYPSADRGN
ncbi:MAG: hypothetical protein Q8R36_04285, partial [bacterium]|nr:hypothetical protein [bacterium]